MLLNLMQFISKAFIFFMTIFYDDFDWFGPFNSIFENRMSDISTKQSIEILIITIIAILC